MPTAMLPQPDSIDIRDQYIAQVVSGKTFAEVGGLWGTVSEKISIAHRYNATALTMIDAASLDTQSYLWQAFHERMATLNITNYSCLTQDICQISKEISKPFDVVHCAGVLYHHPHPMQLLVALRQITREYLILTSAITQEFIENEKGRYQIPPSGVIFVPALNQEEINVLGTYWHQACSARPIGISEKTAYRLDDFAPWWWLPTATALRSMCEVAGFQIVKNELAWKDNALSLLLKVQGEQSVKSSSDISIDDQERKEYELAPLEYKTESDILPSEGNLEEAVQMNDVVLVILFNHPHPENIEILEKVYRHRFQKILYIFPLITHDNPDVLTAYRGSYNFHGYIVDKAKEIMQREASHYVFLQDDVLLNPSINSGNILQYLDLSDDDGFIPDFYGFGGEINWDWHFRFIWKLCYPMNLLSGSGCQKIIPYLPKIEHAEEMFEKYNLKVAPLTTRSSASKSYIWGLFAHNNKYLHSIFWNAYLNSLFATAREGKYIDLPYPFAGGMSDFFIVPRNAFSNFVHTLGVLAAAEVFAEIAIPTALITSLSNVKRNSNTGTVVQWLWDNARDSIYNAEEITAQFGTLEEKLLLIHPVKWSTMMKDKVRMEEWMTQIFPH